MVEKKPVETGLVAGPSEKTNLANVDEKNVLDMLDQDAQDGKIVGIATLKAKEVGEDKDKKLILERRQGDAKTELAELKNARIILRTDQYQLSEKTDSGFSTIAMSSEVYQNKNDKKYIFDYVAKTYQEIQDIREFNELYNKDDLKKNQSLKRFKILYIDTDQGIMKLYLKPSQYVGCFVDKQGYRYSNPMENMFGDIEKRNPVKWYNKTYTITPAKYEKGGFVIAYPEFKDAKANEADPAKVVDIVREILGGIKSYEEERINGDEWQNKVPDEELPF